MDIEKREVETIEILYTETMKYKHEIMKDCLHSIHSIRKRDDLDFNYIFTSLVKGIGFLQAEEDAMSVLKQLPLPSGLKERINNSDKILFKDGLIIVSKEDLDDKTTETIIKHQSKEKNETLEEKLFNGIDSLRTEIFPLTCVFLVAKLATKFDPYPNMSIEWIIEKIMDYITLHSEIKTPVKMIIQDVIKQYNYEVLKPIFEVNPKMDMLPVLLSKETRRECAEIVLRDLADIRHLVMDDSPVM